MKNIDTCQHNIDMLAYEKSKILDGYKHICGIDEAGRGPLAGKVFAAAVILKPDADIEGITDSKKLSPQKREILYDKVIENSLSFSIVSVDEGVIDEINILNATYQAMNEAAEGLSVPPDFVLIDGNSIKNMRFNHQTIVKGDSLCASIAAASILAKVARDKYMLEMAKEYPLYEFEKHKGYGSKKHMELIRMHGPCPIHRKTFKGVKEYI